MQSNNLFEKKLFMYDEFTVGERLYTFTAPRKAIHNSEGKAYYLKKFDLKEYVAAMLYAKLMGPIVAKMDLVRHAKPQEEGGDEFFLATRDLCYNFEQDSSDKCKLSDLLTSLSKQVEANKTENHESDQTQVPYILRLRGVEKVIAHCAVFDERDIHGHNLLVYKIPTKKDFNVTENILCKIDHGFSLERFGFYNSFDINVNNLLWTINNSSSVSNSVQIKMNLSKFIKHLSKIKTFLDDLAADGAAKYKCFLGEVFTFLKDNGVFKDDKEYLTKKNQFSIIYKLSNKLIENIDEVIWKLSIYQQFNDSESFQNKEWMAKIHLDTFTSKIHHPLSNAILTKDKISGQDPIDWFLNNQKDKLISFLHSHQEERNKVKPTFEVTEESDIVKNTNKFAMDAAIMAREELKELNPELWQELQNDYSDVI